MNMEVLSKYEGFENGVSTFLTVVLYGILKAFEKFTRINLYEQ